MEQAAEPLLAGARLAAQEHSDLCGCDATNQLQDVPETVEQYAKDLAAFTMWAAEPHLEQRKAMGFSVMLFLIVFAGLVYFTKKKVWSDVEL